MEDADEGCGRLLVSCCDGSPLLEPSPEPLDPVSVEINPVRTGEGGLIAARGDGRNGSEVSDLLAEFMAAVAPIGDDPFGNARQVLKQGQGLGEFMGLSLSEAEGDGAPCGVGDHAGLGPISATRAAKRFMVVSFCS